MYIGVGKVKLRLPENHSLKGKRHIIKSLMARVRNEYGVAAAEVGSQDLWQVAEIGICCVANEAEHVMEVVSRSVDYIENTHLDAEVVDVQTEVLESL